MKRNSSNLKIGYLGFKKNSVMHLVDLFYIVLVIPYFNTPVIVRYH